MSTKTLFIDEMKKSAKNRKILGFSVHYSVERVDITRDDLETAFDDAGLDDTFLPRHVTMKKAFTRCLGKLAKEPGIILRKVMTAEMNPDLVVYRIVSESTEDASIDVEGYSVERDTVYTKDNLVVFDKKDHTIAFEGSMYRAQIKRAFKEIFDSQLYSTRDIRRMLDDIMIRLGSVKIVSRGGGYFAPMGDYDILGDVETMCRNINKNLTTKVSGVTFLALPIARNKEGEERTKKLAINDIKSQLVKLKEEIDTIDIESPRVDVTLRKKLEEFTNLRNIVAVYSANLKFDAEDIENDIDELESAIMNIE